MNKEKKLLLFLLVGIFLCIAVYLVNQDYKEKEKENIISSEDEKKFENNTVDQNIERCSLAYNCISLENDVNNLMCEYSIGNEYGTILCSVELMEN